MTTKNGFTKAFAAIVLCYVLILAGCGGSNGSSSNNPPPIPVISVSGPASVMVGQQAQYIATENGSPITPTWEVNSVAGGNSTVGTISTAGLYTAPPMVPNPANVTITAMSSGATTGSISVTITAPPPANPVINSFTANPSTIQSGQSSTLSWVTTNGVSLSIDHGVGDVSPVNQGSVVVSPTQTTTYTATLTGAAGTTPATAKTTVTVTPASGGITITSIAPASAYVETYGTLLGIKINGTGFAAGETLKDCAGDLTLPGGTLPNQISLILAFQNGCYSPGWLSFQVKTADGSEKSNPMAMAMYGTPGVLAYNASLGEYYFLNREGISNHGISLFKSDLTPDGSFGGGVTVAADNETGKIIATQPAGPPTYVVYKSPTDTTPWVIGNGAPAMEVDALNHFLGGCQWTANQISYLDLSQDTPPVVTSPAGVVGKEPWLCKMFNVNGGLEAIVYNRGDGQLCAYGIPGFSQNGCVALPGFTKSTDISLANLVNAGWEMVAFRSGPLANSVAIIDRYDHKLQFVNVASMTLMGQPFSLSGDPFNVAADETHGTAIVAFADQLTTLNRFSTFDPVAGTVIPLSTTWTNLAIGLAVNSDGTNLYLLDRDQSKATPNQ